jgi:hypothetical protein
MTAAAALAGGVIFKKFHIVTALRAFYIKNCPFLPVLGILSGTFHGSFLSICDYRLMSAAQISYYVCYISGCIRLMP